MSGRKFYVPAQSYYQTFLERLIDLQEEMSSVAIVNLTTKERRARGEIIATCKMIVSEHSGEDDETAG